MAYGTAEKRGGTRNKDEAGFDLNLLTRQCREPADERLGARRWRGLVLPIALGFGIEGFYYKLIIDDDRDPPPGIEALRSQVHTADYGASAVDDRAFCVELEAWRGARLDRLGKLATMFFIAEHSNLDAALDLLQKQLQDRRILQLSVRN